MKVAVKTLERYHVDLTPMVDMTLLMIAFFTALVNFSEADQNERLKLPLSELAKPSDEAPGQKVMLQVLANGNTIYNNYEYDIEALKRVLEFHKRFLGSINVNQKTVNIIIRADSRCKYEKVQDIIDLCQILGFETFSLRARQGDQLIRGRG